MNSNKKPTWKLLPAKRKLMLIKRSLKMTKKGKSTFS